VNTVSAVSVNRIAAHHCSRESDEKRDIDFSCHANFSLYKLDEELAFPSSSSAFPCKESCPVFLNIFSPFDIRRLWHARGDANERTRRNTGHNQETRMSLLLNPAELVHLNDNETEDSFLSGNENDDYNFKVDSIESRDNTSVSHLYIFQ